MGGAARGRPDDINGHQHVRAASPTMASSAATVTDGTAGEVDPSFPLWKGGNSRKIFRENPWRVGETLAVFLDRRLFGATPSLGALPALPGL